MTTTEAIVLAIVEGLTEFLPVSSTGHMIIASKLLGMKPDEFTKLFTVSIQLGTILSVVVLYFKRFFQSLDFYYKLAFAFLPAAIMGFLLGDFIDSLLENVAVVAVMLLVGGIFMLFIDRIFEDKNDRETKVVGYRSALYIGIFQCIALIPGVSRSAATIVGGLAQGLTKKNAAEFSFFLAVPTMFAATAYKLLKNHEIIQKEHFQLLALGNLVGFVVGVLAIRFFIGILTQYGFKWFGWYRIVLGGVLLACLAAGVSLEIV